MILHSHVQRTTGAMYSVWPWMNEVFSCLVLSVLFVQRFFSYFSFLFLWFIQQSHERLCNTLSFSIRIETPEFIRIQPPILPGRMIAKYLKKIIAEKQKEFDALAQYTTKKCTLNVFNNRALLNKQICVILDWPLRVRVQTAAILIIATKIELCVDEERLWRHCRS